ncbi:apolipoprotein d [Plakobranchus ocellatus]|uniref:Apolipoprotein d n=1 Tax=Plakobranchus ocellatus TaxID=259542 RepID=A0AAV4C0C5_9GAST|nr:apolipoprotein d [Plakobranchus ocellatus]
MNCIFKVKCVTFVVLLLAGSSVGVFVLKPGRCPKVTGQEQFEKTRYAGVWYEYQRFPDVVSEGLDCTSYTFYDTWHSMRVVKNGTLRADFFGNKFIMANISVNGLVTVLNEAKPAELNIVYGKASPRRKANYIIQDTDYKSYSVVFSCTQMQDFNMQNAYILTRVRGVAPPNLAELESKLTEAGVDVSAFFVVHQKGCPDYSIVQEDDSGRLSLGGSHVWVKAGGAGKKIRMGEGAM